MNIIGNGDDKGSSRTAYREYLERAFMDGRTVMWLGEQERIIKREVNFLDPFRVKYTYTLSDGNAIEINTFKDK